MSPPPPPIASMRPAKNKKGQTMRKVSNVIVIKRLLESDFLSIIFFRSGKVKVYRRNVLY